MPKPKSNSESAPEAGARAAVYLAGPLFTIHERRINRELAAAVEATCPAVRVILPQDIKHDDRYNDQKMFGLIFKGCIDAIDESRCVLAWFDGPDADSGTSFEAGYAYAKGIPVVGIRTDFRLSQERGVNVMLSRACAAFVYRPSFGEDLQGLANDVVRALKKVLAIR